MRNFKHHSGQFWIGIFSTLGRGWAAALLFWVSILCLVKFSWATTVSLETQRVPRQDISRISLVGFAGTVELVPLKGAQKFELQVAVERSSERSGVDDFMEDWDIKFKVQDKTWKVEVTGPQNKEAWRKMMARKSYPKYNLKLMGPALPVTLNWRDLKLLGNGWDREVRVQAVQGEVDLQRGKGDISVQLDRGKIAISEQVGSVEVETFQSEVNLTKITGRVSLANFSGVSALSAIQGDLNLKAQVGGTKVEGASGVIEFENGRGALGIVAKSERILGTTDSGNVKVEAKEKINVRIKSKDGFVTVVAPPNSGALVNVGTVEGDLFVPSNFKVDRHPNLKVAQGRLPGGVEGTIHVRSETAGIKVR